ncbi:MAG: TonB family protein [Bdellovibrio sp.]|nr:TonB family protein [Bdellovibrio sp.]
MSRNYDLLALHTQPEPQQPSKYFGLSIFLHTSLAIGALFVTVPALENLKKEVVTIEIQEPEKPIQEVKHLATPLGEPVPATRGAEQAHAPAPSAPMESALAEKVQAPVATSKKSVSLKAQMKTHTGGAVKPVVIAKSAPSRAGVPESIEDIAAPDLDFDGVVASQPGKLGDDELEDNFKKIDKSNAAAIQAQKAELDNDLKQVSDEKDQALQSLEEDNKAQARAMEDALEAKRTKNAAAVAQLKASEQAAREKAARENELAKQAKAAAKGKGFSEDGGSGAGATGEDKPSNQASGEAIGVRSLDELRQMPGNPKPQYSVEERLRREQGFVAFHAYISKAGLPTQFRITQSTGFRNLDGKTLSALKKWKFYPGQEGWVEIPFKWDIKGGVQEVPTLLRRARYGSNN